MENIIKKYIESLKKKATKEAISEAEVDNKLKPKLKADIRERVALEYTITRWLANNLTDTINPSKRTFIPSKKAIAVFDFLALEIGYKRTVKQAFDDEFPLLEKLLEDLNDDEFMNYKEKVKSISPEVIPLYSFFKEQIETAYDDGMEPQTLIVDKVTNLSKKAKTGARVSHASKFSNPDVKWPRIYAKATKSLDGFVRTGNDEVDFDMHINAAALQVFKLLSMEIDQVTILELFENDMSEPIMSCFEINIGTYELWKSGFCQSLITNQGATNSLIKQVFFPVEESYHQLSILFPSGLVFKMKEEIDMINMLSTDSYLGKIRKKRGEYYQNTYDTIFDITHQRFGGDHPKNISGLNNKHQNVYLLRSMPPELSARTVQPPKANFFTQSLWAKAFQGDFQKFNDLLKSDITNVHVRRQRDWIIRNIIYQVADRLWMIRHLDAGWSDSDNYTLLPQYQKIWLDQLYTRNRDEDMQWFDSVRGQLARWFLNTYSNLMGEKAISVGDDQLQHIKTIIDECEEALR